MSPTPKKADKAEYINNAMLYKAIVDWRESGRERISEELGKYIMLLSRKIAKHRNFNRYSGPVIEEMISESTISMLKAIPKFDHVKYDNPFSYLTSVAFNTNIGVISKHYKENAKSIRYFLENSEVIDTTDGSTLVHIDQERQYRESVDRKKATIKERKAALNPDTTPKLF